MLATILAILAPAWGWIIAGAGLLITVAVSWLHGRSVGVADEQAQHVQDRLNAIEESRKLAEKVGSLPAADVDSRLSKWLRDQSG